jgi:hypothetical protein
LSHQSSETQLSMAEAVYYLCLVLNQDKYDRCEKFCRTGMNRRQDHGSRNNSRHKGCGRKYFEMDYFGMPDDYEVGRRHKDYRRGSEDQTRGVIRSHVQREMKILELNEALLEAGLFFWRSLERFDFFRHKWYPMGQI